MTSRQTQMWTSLAPA